MNDFLWNLKQVSESIPPYNSHAATSFFRPHDGIWPDIPESFPALENDIHAALSEVQQRRFLSVCLASYLLNPSKAPGGFGRWLLDKISIKNLLGLDLTFEQLTDCQWGRVAIPLADPSECDREQVAYAVVGLSRTAFRLPLFPSWIQSSLDCTAQDAVKICSGLIVKRYPECSMLFWPVTNQAANSSLINGTSLGLPVYLSFYSLANGCGLPNILATGIVDADGSLAEIKFLEIKFQLAKRKGFSTVIYPQLSGIDLLAANESHPECVPVDTLRQAETVWSQHCPGAGREIANFMALLNQPFRLIEQLADIPEILLPFDPQTHSQINKALNLALSGDIDNPEPFNHFLKKLETMLDKPAWDVNRTSALLGLLDIGKAERLADITPSCAFRLASLKIRYANHSGDVAMCNNWFPLAKRFFEMKRHRDPDDRDMLLLLVNTMIGTLHNTYTFSPTLPDVLQKALDEILEEMEIGYLKSKQKYPNQINIPLASYYGTIAQNYAFCGPDYLYKVEEFTAKALEAFGNCRIIDKDLKDNCLRQYCYLTYAYLDAQLIDKAEKTLMKYLEVERLEDFDFTIDNPFKHALLARFLADSGREFLPYVAWAETNPFRQNRHPWQLWSNNMGTLTTDPIKKEKYWKQSVEICLNSGEGETVKVMALLPLAALCKCDCEDHSFIRTAVNQLIKGIDSPVLHRIGLDSMLANENDLFTALARLDDEMKTLFPFSYR